MTGGDEGGRDWRFVREEGWPAWHPEGYEYAPEFGQEFIPVYRCEVERGEDGKPHPVKTAAGENPALLDDSEPIPEHGWRHFDDCHCGDCAPSRDGLPQR